MTRFNRTQFAQAHDRFTQLAMENYLNDGYIQPVLITFRKDGGYHVFMVLHPDAVDSPMTQKARRNGIGVLRAPLRDHLAEVKGVLATAETVACVLVNEVWTAFGDVAQAVMATPDKSIGDHPGHGEAIAVTGIWPRELYSRTKHIPITRTETGAGVLGEPEDLTALYRDRGTVVEEVSWLADMLPQPYGHRTP